MAFTRYALDDFIHEMTELVSARPDQTTLFDRGARLSGGKHGESHES